MPTNDALATAIAALEFRYNWALMQHKESDDPYYVEMMAEIDAAIAELTTQQADSAAVAMPVADWSNAPSWAMWWTRDDTGLEMWWEGEVVFDGRYGIWMCETETRRERATILPLKQRRPAQE